MEMEIVILLLFVIIALAGAALFVGMTARGKITTLEKVVSRQTALLTKMQENFRARNASDACVQNAEIIYQDLLQHIAPIAKAVEIPPRESEQHPLWRTLGGLVDEYSRNPYVLESLRRLIKLDSDIARGTDTFLLRSERLLHHLATSDPDGLLAATFADGLLGQAMTLLSQARQLAQNP
ncbi:MAG: hypothetical protein FWE64_02020 [Alphaproteobacteria bacterium]|nr:hypothetical protein [Alphaproteobacteria bacterium]